MNNKLRRSALLAAATSGGDDFYNPNPNYLTIVALEDGCEVDFTSYEELEYSIDGSDNWVTITMGDVTPAINAGQYISFRGNWEEEPLGSFTISTPCNLTGNCNSILFGDDAANNLDLSEHINCYYGLFSDCPIVEVSPTFLPATTLANGCYEYLFQNCTSLIAVPELPATTLASSCYNGMFYGCTSLVIAPELPATTLADNCYQSMFFGCTSLVIAPELPATTLLSSCYQYMFRGCSKLTVVPQLPAIILAKSCYQYMFHSCTSLTTAPELPATTLASSCYYGMFQNCTSLITAPALPATALLSNCYYYMFRDCSKLNYIKALFTTTPSIMYTSNWVSGVASSGTFVKNKNATWNVTGTSGIPSGWTVQTA